MNIALTLHQVANQTDELTDLILRCAENERSAQEALYRKFYPRMMALVRRYIDQPVEAEEIINNGYLKAFQKIKQYTFKGSFEGWLRKIVFHAVSDYVKGKISYDQHTIFIEKDELIDNNVVANLNYNKLLELVHQLPFTTKAVFNMNVMEGMSHKEIAAVLNISEGTSKWHLSEARKMLKLKIEKLNLY